MKNLILSIFLMLTTYHVLQAQLKLLRSAPDPYATYTNNDFSYCGTPSFRSFRVSYSQCPNIFGVNCVGGCGANPFRYTVSLQRNGVTISTQTFRASSDWSNTFFYSVTAVAATYRAHIKVELRKRNCLGWNTLFSGYTNTITALKMDAVPNFHINQPPIFTLPYVTSCISNIRINAGNTFCETRYYIGVEESDEWWNRTYDYEWGLWFGGQAPNNINLQQLASTYSVPPHFTGSPSRQGQILIGGNLPSGHKRFYRVSVCTDEPSWKCKSTLLRVDQDCVLDPSTIIEDMNEYTWIDNNEFAQKLQDSDIETLYEAEIDENQPFLENHIPTISSLSPNPFNSSTTVRIDPKIGEALVLFELYNSLGECVRSIKTQKQQFELQRNELLAGVYMYRIIVKGKILDHGKVIIE